MTSRFHDHIAKAESDSGYQLHVSCPACKGSHMVALTRAGRFMCRCGTEELSGQLTPDAVTEMRAHLAAERLPGTVRCLVR